MAIGLSLRPMRLGQPRKSFVICVMSLSGWKLIFLIYRFVWKRTSFVLGHSTIDVFWDIPVGTEIGNYRIRHFGYARHILGGIYEYKGTSKPFAVVH